jgi:hypothetical protein
MPQLEKIAENAWAKIVVRYVLPPITVVFFGLITWLLHDMSSKIDGAAARGEVVDMQKAVWNAISKNTEAQTVTTTTLATITAELKAHKELDVVQATATHDAMQQLELARGRGNVGSTFMAPAAAPAFSAPVGPKP